MKKVIKVICVLDGFRDEYGISSSYDPKKGDILTVKNVLYCDTGKYYVFEEIPYLDINGDPECYSAESFKNLDLITTSLAEIGINRIKREKEKDPITAPETEKVFTLDAEF